MKAATIRQGTAPPPPPPLGRKPELAWLPVGRIAADPRYQRDTGSRRSGALIEKIASAFKWSRFGVVLAVKAGDGWHAIDGQHRIAAARKRGIGHVPAVVLSGVTVAEAAADFVAINRDRVTVTALHIHHAMLAANEDIARAVDRAARAAGVTIPRYPIPADKLKPGQTLAVVMIRGLVARKGEDSAAKVLKRVVAVYGRAPGAICAPAIRAAAAECGFSDGHAASKPVEARHAPKLRACLACRKPFLSEGAGNRICPKCKGIEDVENRRPAKAGAA